MIGGRIERLARWLLRPDTYLSIVEPAIADLQFETQQGAITRARAYIGVWRAIAAALVYDLATDTGHAVRALGRPVPLRHGACTLVLVTVPMLLVAPPHFEPWWWALLLYVPCTIPIAMLPALTLAVREAARATKATWGFLSIAAFAAMLVFVAIDQGVTRTNQAYREAASSAAGIRQAARGAREMTVSELLDRTSVLSATAGRTVSPARIRTLHRQFVREAHVRMSLAAGALAYVVLGIGLASVRLRCAWLMLLAFTVVHTQVLVLPRLVGPHGTLATIVVAVWLAPATMGAIAAIAVWRQARQQTTNAISP